MAYRKNLLIEISLEIFHFIKGILEKLARMRFRKFSWRQGVTCILAAIIPLSALTEETMYYPARIQLPPAGKCTRERIIRSYTLNEIRAVAHCSSFKEMTLERRPMITTRCLQC